MTGSISSSIYPSSDHDFSVKMSSSVLSKLATSTSLMPDPVSSTPCCLEWRSCDSYTQETHSFFFLNKRIHLTWQMQIGAKPEELTSLNLVMEVFGSLFVIWRNNLLVLLFLVLLLSLWRLYHLGICETEFSLLPVKPSKGSRIEKGED